MAAEPTEITISNREDIEGYLRHILADLHELQRDVGPMAEAFRKYAPALAALTGNGEGPTMMGLRAARKNARRA
jgi:hypothetical protein